MTDILATIKSLGIADADIQTTNVSLYPQYGNGALPRSSATRSASRSRSRSAISTRPVT
jgi:uncharacterized protein YggE